jgi:hypothetical protein
MKARGSDGAVTALDQEIEGSNAAFACSEEKMKDLMKKVFK